MSVRVYWETEAVTTLQSLPSEVPISLTKKLSDAPEQAPPFNPKHPLPPSHCQTLQMGLHIFGWHNSDLHWNLVDSLSALIVVKRYQ